MNTLIRLIIAAATVVAATLAVSATPPSASAESTVRPYTLVIGDSLTYYGRAALLDRRPHWIVDGVRGRSVNDTLMLINRWSVRKGADPARIVVALGTNESRWWKPSDYRAVQKALPRTKVLFVTPWRDVSYPRNAGRGDTMFGYAQSMRSLAKHSNRVCIADWAARVRNNPDRFLRDGVHQTRYGIRVWSWLVASRMSAC